MRTELDHYRYRFMQQLLQESLAIYWERRAAAFDEGSGLRAACEAKAYVCRVYGPPPEVFEAIAATLDEQTNSVLTAATELDDARARRSAA